jgi:NADPH:quinone reductase-like Zn-dependent oxidoreductase
VFSTDLRFKNDVVPCSDGAGEIVSVGSAVPQGKWNVGDKVAVNFCTDHVVGVSSPAINNTALGGAIDGVLTQYMTVPAHVSD